MVNKMKEPDHPFELDIIMCYIQSVFDVSDNLTATAAKLEGIFFGELW